MSDKTDEILTYLIPEWNMPALAARVAKLNKRAVKLGCEPIEVVIHEEQYVTDSQSLKIKVCKISIEGAAPKLAGWKFIGTLDHYSLPGKVIVNTVPGEIIPQKFHNGDPVCNHCGKIRHRKETFIIENEDGDLQQVGRQCLKDFLGHNPQGLVGFLQSIYDLADELGNEKSGFYGGSGEYYYELDYVLSYTVAVIRSYGWTPRSVASEERTATANYVEYAMHVPTDSKELKEWDIFIKNLAVNDADTAEGKKAVQWLTKQEDNNEYMHNIKMIAEAGQLTDKLFGYACSIVAAYQRAEERLRVEKAQPKLNEHLAGEIKDRIELNVKLINIHRFESQFGVVSLCKMLDNDGRSITWFANTDPDMAKNCKYRIKGTIKKFDEYNEWCQTVLTRVKVLEELEVETKKT